MSNNYKVSGIVWDQPAPGLPEEAYISLLNHLLDLGYEDFESPAFHSRVDAMNDDEAEVFWESYEPSLEAMDAFDTEWTAEIERALEAAFGAKVRSTGHFELVTEQVKP